MLKKLPWHAPLSLSSLDFSVNPYPWAVSAAAHGLLGCLGWHEVRPRMKSSCSTELAQDNEGLSAPFSYTKPGSWSLSKDVALSPFVTVSGPTGKPSAIMRDSSDKIRQLEKKNKTFKKQNWKSNRIGNVAEVLKVPSASWSFLNFHSALHCSISQIQKQKNFPKKEG